jgi:hypothetical protein
MEQQPIVARCIVEILGAPKEHVVKELREHIDKIKQEGLDVQIEKYAEPEAKDKLWNHFVELQVAFKDPKQLLDFCFDSMPSTVEIMSPDKMTLDMAMFEEFINDFQTKLHHTDVMLKGLQAQKQVLDRNALNILHNFIKFACKTRPHTIDEISELVGMDKENLSTFLSGLVEKGALKKEGEAFITDG